MKKKSKIIITFCVISVILIVSILPVAAASADSEYYNAYNAWQYDKTNTFIFDNRSISERRHIKNGIYVIALPSSKADFNFGYVVGNDIADFSVSNCDNVKTGFFLFNPTTKTFSNVPNFTFDIRDSDYNDVSVFSKYAKLAYNDISFGRTGDTKITVSKHFSFSFSNFKPNDFLFVLNQIKYLIPILLPAVVGFLAFRKGWAFLKGEVRSA